MPTDTWVRYGEQGLEYYLSTSPKTYSDALLACRAIGTGMAKVLNEEMASAFLAAFGLQPYVIDLNDIEEGKLFAFIAKHLCPLLFQITPLLLLVI